MSKSNMHKMQTNIMSKSNMHKMQTNKYESVVHKPKDYQLDSKSHQTHRSAPQHF